jgi:BioD-like phosphotransacetylase family protein
MIPLYVTSVERYSGKTAVCLAIGKQFQADGYKVGYLKPLSLQPWRIGGRIADEDAAFVKAVLGLDADPVDLSPVVVTEEFLYVHLTGQEDCELMPRVKAACVKAGEGKDFLLLEGGGSLREGYAMGLPTQQVANELGSKVLVVVKFRGRVRLMDDTLAAHFRLGNVMAGVIINRVPLDDIDFVKNIAIPHFEDKGIPILGILPEDRSLSAITVEEINNILEARILTHDVSLNGIVENLMVGAMTAEAALSRMRKVRRKAVITGGDRTDIQLAALETSTSCLILTGNLEPRPLIIKQANELGVPVLLVRENTLETVEVVDNIFGKTRLGQSEKLEVMQQLMNENFNWKRLYEKIGI